MSARIAAGSSLRGCRQSQSRDPLSRRRFPHHGPLATIFASIGHAEANKRHLQLVAKETKRIENNSLLARSSGKNIVNLVNDKDLHANWLKSDTTDRSILIDNTYFGVSPLSAT
jgi:hypothetical protein